MSYSELIYVSKRVAVEAKPQLFWDNCKTADRIWRHHLLKHTAREIGTHYSEVIMGAMVSQITSFMVVYSTVYSGADKKHHSSASLAFVWGIHRSPVNSPHKRPVTRKRFLFDDVIMHDWQWSLMPALMILFLCIVSIWKPCPYIVWICATQKDDEWLWVWLLSLN